MIKNNYTLISVVLILVLLTTFILVAIGNLDSGWFALIIGIIFGYAFAIDKNE